MTRLREALALFIAPWLGRRYEDDYERALGDLAERAYGDRFAVWTSPRVLVKAALDAAAMSGRHNA